LAESGVGLARQGDFAGAAAEALRLAGHLQQDNRFGQAADIADRAGTLVGAIRGGDPQAIAQAAAGLGGAVDAARRGYNQPDVQQARFAQTLLRVGDMLKTVEQGLQAAKNGNWADGGRGLRLANQLHNDRRLEPAARVAEGTGDLVAAIQGRDARGILQAGQGLADNLGALRDAFRDEKRTMVRTGEMSPGRDQVTNLAGKVDDLARAVVSLQRLMAA
jgi:hypothetical protein